MPKIDTLPSGRFRARVFSHTDENGKKHYKSITGDSKKEVKLKIAEFELDKKEEAAPIETKTVREAIEAYIEAKSNVLSPSTIRGYNVILRNRLKSIMNIEISRLTLSDIQKAINADAEKCSPKSIRNENALLQSAILLVAPEFKYTVTLPQKKKTEICIPTESEVKKMFELAKGTKIETALYLAAMCGMRRSEIAALLWKDVDLVNGTISIVAAAVPDNNNNTVRKLPKTVAGTRTIIAFRPVLEHLQKLEHTSEYVVEYTTPNSITDGFLHLIQKAKIPHYRFHDLRHYAVSVMLMLNLPKKYIANYIGHSNEHLIENVYGHIMRDKKEDMFHIVDEYFAKFSKDMT